MRTRVLFPRVIRVKLDSPQINESPYASLKNKIMFVSGTLLAISESLPFVTNVQANGILDAIKKIREEYKSLE
jgi:hypothetical protein